jgi:SAM-dependent methyltransferase
MRRCLGCDADLPGTSWPCERCGHRPVTDASGRLLFAPSLAQGGGFDADYLFDELVAAEPHHFWFRSRRRLILDALARYFPSARRFLDLGCGTGFVLMGARETFPALELSGSDVRAEALDRAAQRVPGAFLFQMDGRRMPFTEEFDVIGAFDVIEHVPEDDAMLREMHRALRPGGGLLLTVPQHPWLWSEADDFSHHQRRYSRRGLRARLRSAGFEILQLTSFCSLLMPALVADRWWRRLRRAVYDPASELRLTGVNDVLERVMQLEAALIARGLSLPAGGSLLAVARRPD